jgi:hypothetical protein
MLPPLRGCVMAGFDVLQWFHPSGVCARRNFVVRKYFFRYCNSLILNETKTRRVDIILEMELLNGYRTRHGWYNVLRWLLCHPFGVYRCIRVVCITMMPPLRGCDMAGFDVLQWFHPSGVNCQNYDCKKYRSICVDVNNWFFFVLHSALILNETKTRRVGITIARRHSSRWKTRDGWHKIPLFFIRSHAGKISILHKNYLYRYIKSDNYFLKQYVSARIKTG